MAYWLIKEEPSHYSYEDLVREGATRWTGVHNALALRNLRQMAAGDLAVYYHTGSERACVGLVRITSTPRPDPADPRGSWWVEVRPVRSLRRSISLAELKQDPELAGIDLLRIPRLSVIGITGRQWARVLGHERAGVGVAAPVTEAATGRGRAGGKGPKRTAARRRH